jgi:hypothetical protein
MTGKISASELFAISQGEECCGTEECHWCASKCDRRWLHDDPPPVPFARTKSSARRPSNHYVCVGCQVYRRPSVTINFLSGGIKDRQTLKNHGWWLDEAGVWAVRTPQDSQALYKRLLNPPTVFALALLNDDRCENLLNLAFANDNASVAADTVLKFTVNNVPHEYTVYELIEGLRHGAEGKMGGVRALIGLLGPIDVKPEEKRPRGRPVAEDRSPRRVVTSG